MNPYIRLWHVYNSRRTYAHMSLTLSVDEFMAQDDGAGLSWIVEDMLPRPGWVLLIGAAKAGKSSLALELGRCVAAGEAFLGRPSQKSTLLYLPLDGSPPIWRRALHTARQHGVVFPPGFQILNPRERPISVDILTPAGVAYLKASVAAVDPALVVVDVLRETSRADENDSGASKAVADALAACLVGRAVVIVHHLAKVPEDVTRPDAIRYARGSTYWTGRVDAFWLLWQDRLYVTPRWAPPTTINLQRLPSGLWKLKEKHG